MQGLSRESRSHELREHFHLDGLLGLKEYRHLWLETMGSHTAEKFMGVQALAV